MKTTFRFSDIKLARVAKNKLLENHVDKSNYKKACQKIDEGFEDAFQYNVVRKGHNRLKSTNLIVRLNQKVHRREKVIRIFPNVASAKRLIGTI